ncbi:hypothetical protein LCGC14_1233600 [marine sediment metagenome]|uniref:Uncharacterized protein n=1 Tax=marine sediment metagenome TaxID=412755 RepID=A0A0F9NQ03_9ZZZZ
MTNWRIKDTALRGILERNDDDDNEIESVANTKKELIPHLKTALHFKALSPDVVAEMDRSTTFHSFNRALDKVFGFADRNLIWIELN